jgi:hypothetical protein
MHIIDHEIFDRAVAAERRRLWRTRVLVLIAMVIGLAPVGWVAAGFALGYSGRQRLIAAPLMALVAVTIAFVGILGSQWIVSRIMLGFLQPGGMSRGAGRHSKAEALAASGLFEEASAEFEKVRVTLGDSIPSLRAEAELHATASGNPARAEELFQRIRRAPHATSNDELYASHRLLDLYIGPLNDEGRVLVELRRMAERFPNTPDGQGALAELRRRRAEAA